MSEKLTVRSHLERLLANPAYDEVLDKSGLALGVAFLTPAGSGILVNFLSPAEQRQMTDQDMLVQVALHSVVKEYLDESGSIESLKVPGFLARELFPEEYEEAKALAESEMEATRLQFMRALGQEIPEH